jgi:hypothetical protein
VRGQSAYRTLRRSRSSGWDHERYDSSYVDPFATDPIRRSFIAVVGSLCVLIVPWIFGRQFGETALLTIGWLALTIFILSLPVLFWGLGEAAVALLLHRCHPTVDQLSLSPRVLHILERHGFSTIDMVEHAPDQALLMLSNMDQRGVQEVRRAIAIWKYRRWQDRGFPAIQS